MLNAAFVWLSYRPSTFKCKSDGVPPIYQQVSEFYTPERAIGKGGFGYVYMAKSNGDASSKPAHVAIKVVNDDGYANREISILSELTKKYSHPNIVQLLEEYGPQAGDDPNTLRCLVLSLAHGPTLNYIMQKRGALSMMMAQTISSQLINTVAFLHGHGVIHRDIQPCNIIVSGTSIDDDLWWSDDLDANGIVANYVQRCHITLIDFVSSTNMSCLYVLDLFTNERS
jgi:serine/threonine protein kinase